MPKSRKDRDFRYNHSEKGRARRIRYNHSELGRIQNLKYNRSEKGRRRNERSRCSHTPITTEKIWRLILSGYR